MKLKPILYNLVPFDPAGHHFKVTMTIADPDPKGQIVSLPAWIPGSYLIRDFARQIETITAKCRSAKVPLTKTDNHTWRAAPCTGSLVISIVVYAWDLSVRGAHLDEAHGFVNGTSVFLCAKGKEANPCLLTIEGLPNRGGAWRVYTSLPPVLSLNAEKSRLVSRSEPAHYRANNYDELVDHPIEMGRPQVARFKACGAEHEMVFTGLIPNLDIKRITQDVKKICEAQIRFFEPETGLAPFLDSALKYVFLTTVVGDGYGGLEHRASTALIAARKDLPVIGQAKAPAGYATFLGLVSHEYFHTWNVKRIEPAAFAPYNFARENHTSLLWLFEGFTSYYDELFLLRSGIVDKKDYLTALGKQISTVWATPGRHKQSVAQSSFDAWTRYYKQDENSANAIVSYYSKGALIALGLDLKIRQDSAERFSLDDVMRALWQQFGKNFYRAVGQGIAEKAFVKLVRETTGVEVSDEISRWVDGTDDVELNKLFARQGIELIWQNSTTLPTLNVRVRKQGDQLILAQVLEHGAAHRGGLSALDALVAIDGLKVEPNQASFDQLLSAYQPGDRVEVHVFRRDELRQFTVELAPPPLSDCVLKVAAEASSRA